MPRISLVVPAYNVEDFIGRCLDSIRAQSFEDYEVYVVDDASTDGTAAAIEKNIYGDNRFVCIRLTENRGLHVVRKVGLEACKGDYTLFLDGDDELAPGMLAELDAQAELREGRGGRAVARGNGKPGRGDSGNDGPTKGGER